MVKQKEKSVEELMESEQETPQQTSKIPPKRVASDDCAIYVDRVIEDGEITDEGAPYYVHQGEWVELLPTTNLDEMFALAGVVASSDSDDPKRIIVDSAKAMKELFESLSLRIVAWNWTDNNFAPLDQPSDNPKVLEQITNDELMWLMSAVQGKETSADRKND